MAFDAVTPGARRSLTKNVILDLGGVLLDWSPDKIVSRMYGEGPIRVIVKQAVFLHPDWLALDQGILDIPAAIRNFSRRSGRPEEEMERLLSVTGECLTPLPHAVALLDKLQQSGLRLYCLSNMNETVFNRARENADFWHKFSGIVISGIVKKLKPDPAIFKILLTSFQLKPQETVFIDDGPANVESAQRLGINGILFRSAEDCLARLTPLLS